MNWQRRLAGLGVLLSLFLCQPVSVVRADEASPPPSSFLVPSLAVPIPGVTFRPPTQSGNEVNIPFLADYINGVYRFSITLGMLLAIIMVMWGGFRYLAGATVDSVSRGKEIIENAVAGFAILLGAATLLNTVSPLATRVQTITVPMISREDQIQMETHIPTGDSDGDGAPDTGGGGGGNITPPSGSFSSRQTCGSPTPDCPIQDLPPGNPNCGDQPQSQNQRLTAFRQEAPQYLHATGRQRVVEAALLAARCGVMMGSCGASANLIRQIAGVPSGREDDYHLVNTLLKPTMCMANSCEPIPGCNRPSGADMRTTVRNAVRAEQDARADSLQPGDWFMIFNGNPSCPGGHSVVFLAWADQQRGTAVTVWGQWGKNVVQANYCLKSGCGNYQPIYKIRRLQ